MPAPAIIEEVPEVPAAALPTATSNDPDDADVELPDSNVTEPVFPVVAAPVVRAREPVELVEEPELRDANPEDPPTAAPLPSVTLPLLPDAVVPELNNSTPLLPLDTAFADTIVIEPVLAEELAPEYTNILPPVLEAASAVPALNTI